MEIKENHPLRDLTTFKIGGPARYYVRATSTEDLHRACSFAREKHLPVMVLGGGSNILVSDTGYDGLAIHNCISGWQLKKGQGRRVLVHAGAGMVWDECVRLSVEEGLSGLECLSAIPGTVGAAPVQNIGAYGQSAGTSITEVEVYDTLSGADRVLTAEDCRFGYRRSLFNKDVPDRYIITGAVFSLDEGQTVTVEYRDLKSHFNGQDYIPTAQVREAVIAIRVGKGMAIVPGQESYHSAGSFFTNPVVPEAVYESLKETVRDRGGCEHWAWPLPQGMVKVSAACLIQLAGFPRGYRMGEAGLSPKHTLCLVNYGTARAEDILGLAGRITETVREIFGITLTAEVRMVGFDRPGMAAFCTGESNNGTA